MVRLCECIRSSGKGGTDSRAGRVAHGTICEKMSRGVGMRPANPIPAAATSRGTWPTGLGKQSLDVLGSGSGRCGMIASLSIVHRTGLEGGGKHQGRTSLMFMSFLCPKTTNIFFFAKISVF